MPYSFDDFKESPYYGSKNIKIKEFKNKFIEKDFRLFATREKSFDDTDTYAFWQKINTNVGTTVNIGKGTIITTIPAALFFW